MNLPDNTAGPSAAPVCVRCRWNIPSSLIEGTAPGARCGRCGYRLDDALRNARAVLEASRKGPPTFEEKTGHPRWIAALISVAVLSLLLLIFLAYSQIRERSTAEKLRAQQFQREVAYVDELKLLLEAHSTITSLSPDFAVAEAIDSLTLKLKESPNIQDEGLRKEIVIAENRLQELMQLKTP